MYRIPLPGQMGLIVGKSSLLKGQLARATDLFPAITHFRDFSNHQRMCGDWFQAFSTTLSTTVLIELSMDRDQTAISLLVSGKMLLPICSDK